MPFRLSRYALLVVSLLVTGCGGPEASPTTAAPAALPVAPAPPVEATAEPAAEPVAIPNEVQIAGTDTTYRLLSEPALVLDAESRVTEASANAILAGLGLAPVTGPGVNVADADYGGSGPPGSGRLHRTSYRWRPARGDGRELVIERSTNGVTFEGERRESAQYVRLRAARS